MIDLNYTKAQMLADINASEKVWANHLTEMPAPEFVTLEEAFLVVSGSTPDEFLSGLDVALSARFADVPPEKRHRDLYYPLKKGLGNAYKWGNRKDPEKEITVEVVATKTGALIAIADEGEGFDVDLILQQFQGNEQYYAHGGSGFEHFERAQSVISYAERGRTLLIRFLCAPESNHNGGAMHSSYGAAVDETKMISLFAAQLPQFRKNDATIESCKIYPSDDTDDQQIKYVLEYRQDDSAESKSMTLTGRLLPEAVAQKDYTLAAQLHEMQAGKLIPRPVALFKEPSLVLFDFNPAKDLRAYLKKIDSFQEVAEIFKQIATGLRALHDSAIDVQTEDYLEDALARYRAIREQILSTLGQTGTARAERFQEFFSRLLARGAELSDFAPVPIHGRFGWDHIVHGDGHLYFYRFEECRRSHPGFDLGSFLAEMRRFYLLRRKADHSFYHDGRDVFLATYFKDDSPAWQVDVPFFTAAALLLRLGKLLERPEEKWQPKVDALLEQCEQALE